jgi:hypothetical protein
MDWIKITTPHGPQYFRTSTIVGILPMIDNGVPCLGVCALIVQGLPGPCVVQMSQQQVLDAISNNAAPSIKLAGVLS